MIKKRLFYLFIRIIIFPLSLLPFCLIYLLGNFLGHVCFHLMKNYRKRALSNLALAEGPWNESPAQMKRIAKESFQNLMITCLEYAKFAKLSDISKRVTCINPEPAASIIKQGQGIIFFCGHQANWEVLFLEGTKRMPGVAIGRPIKNEILYKWITSIREKYGGTMITPRNALREGLRGLKKGKFLGIVGDQGMPESSYAYPFFGKRAWTSPAPAILAYKTKCPIMVANTVRKKGKYYIHYSEAIWPDFSEPLEKEIDRLMTKSLNILEDSIAENPGQWLWQHNRWKQQTPHNIYYRFRKDPILIILPKEKDSLLDDLKAFKEIYPKMFTTLLVPKNSLNKISYPDAEILPYEKREEILLDDYRFKLVFDLTGSPEVKKHYLKLSAFEILTPQDLKEIAQEHLLPNKEYTFSEILKRAICRPGTLWQKEETHA